jgi:hypothetical protein
MDLEDFISTTLTQIAKGIEKASQNLEDSNALISPRNIQPVPKNEFKVYGYLESQEKSKYLRVVEQIEFDVALTALQGEDRKGGVGVMVGSIGIGVQGKTQEENSSLSRVKFRVPMVLPNPQKKNLTE